MYYYCKTQGLTGTWYWSVKDRELNFDAEGVSNSEDNARKDLNKALDIYLKLKGK